MSHYQMHGHLIDESTGQIMMRGGFLPATGIAAAFGAAPNSEKAQFGVQRGLSTEVQESLGAIERGEFSGDINAVIAQMGQEIAALQRNITTGVTAFPVRENLEAPAVTLIPTDTPFRNLLPRVPGAGLAAAWRQLTTLGGGWGTGYDQAGGGSAKRMFYAEGGAPSEYTSTYVAKSASYKLLGAMGSVTGFAMAAGANFQDQLGTERRNVLRNTMLNEELALLYGDATSTAAPWGDGSNALAFNGIMNLVTTGNGTPSDQVQTSVGTLSTSHIDAQITRLWKQGGDGFYMLVNAQEAVSLAKLLQASGAIRRFEISDAGNATLGFRVAQYIHPVSGKPVDIYVSRFMIAGEMLFGSRYLPDGRPAAEVEVLPQVPVTLAPENPQQLQGYVVTDLARSLTAPDVHPFMISVYEVLKLRSAIHMAKSTGVTAVS